MATIYYAFVGVFLGGFLAYLHTPRPGDLDRLLLAVSALGFFGAVSLLLV
ncbi:hypothetical protein [Halobacterium sp. R2-5]|nr:hypothetical protein [Halobacterium sp. R2-5]NIB98737.1 hypothetical protein [Halobacterium sp. R2-5]